MRSLSSAWRLNASESEHKQALKLRPFKFRFALVCTKIRTRSNATALTNQIVLDRNWMNCNTNLPRLSALCGTWAFGLISIPASVAYVYELATLVNVVPGLAVKES